MKKIKFKKRKFEHSIKGYLFYTLLTSLGWFGLFIGIKYFPLYGYKNIFIILFYGVLTAIGNSVLLDKRRSFIHGN